MTRDSSYWHIDGCRAHLLTRLLQTEIDLEQPSAGLMNAVFGGVRLEQMSLLQLGPVRPAAGVRLIESYVRGRDLIAAYEPSPAQAARPQVYWRALEFSREVAGLDLIISMHTEQPESDPRIGHRSVLPTWDVWSLTGTDQPVFEQLLLSDASQHVIKSGHHAGAFLFRFPRLGVSYAEMVLPAQFQSAELRAHQAVSGTAELSYQLFPNRVERGVIQRGRLRAVFLPHHSDRLLAAECYRQLVNDSLPLTT